MPHNLEAEQSVLGCVLIDNDSTIGAISRMREEDFYSPSHRAIFSAMRAIMEKNTPVDFVTLVSALTTAGTLESIGGVAYITALNDIVPSAANFRHYVSILKRYRVLRRLIAGANHIIEESHIATDEHAALQIAEKAIFDIAKEDERRELTNISNELPAVLERLDIIQKDPTAVRGLQTGFFGLDDLTNGLQKSDLIILAARPSVGKTSLGLNIVLNAAIKRKAKAAVFSLEMSKQSLTTRALCSAAKVSLSKAMKGELSADEWKRIWEANKLLSASNIHIDDNSVITPSEILRKCMRLKREQGLDVVMVDYLGLMTGGSKRENRQVEVADNSRYMKILAKELDVPVILLSQLNRGIEARKGSDARPMLSDLRESGAIEQDADLVMFIHRPQQAEGPDQEVVDDAVSEVELIIAKQRNGPLGIVKLNWISEHTTFANQMSEQSAQDAKEKLEGRKKPAGAN